MIERIKISQPDMQIGPLGESCASCRYFATPEGQGAECRRKAPLGVLAPNAAGQPVAIGFWPSTRRHQWCGEYESAPSKLV